MTGNPRIGYFIRVMSLKRIHPLKLYRLANGWSQTEAAKHFGMSQAEWSRIERGQQRPNRERTKLLMRETGVSLDVLMGVAP